jgi:hypothetical protein
VTCGWLSKSKVRRLCCGGTATDGPARAGETEATSVVECEPDNQSETGGGDHEPPFLELRPQDLPGGQKDVSLTPWLQPGEKGRHGRSKRFNGLEGGADSPSNDSDRSPARKPAPSSAASATCSVSEWSVGFPPQKQNANNLLTSVYQ